MCGNTCRKQNKNMRREWLQKEEEGTQIKECASVQQVEHEAQRTCTRNAPIFAAFSGMDLLGRGIKKTFPAGKCAGGSEKNNTARLLFKRQHGFEHFRDQQLVPDYAYDKIFMVTTGAPCVAFSLAGNRGGKQMQEVCKMWNELMDTFEPKYQSFCLNKCQRRGRF